MQIILNDDEALDYLTLKATVDKLKAELAEAYPMVVIPEFAKAEMDAMFSEPKVPTEPILKPSAVGRPTKQTAKLKSPKFYITGATRADLLADLAHATSGKCASSHSIDMFAVKRGLTTKQLTKFISKHTSYTLVPGADIPKTDIWPNGKLGKSKLYIRGSEYAN